MKKILINNFVSGESAVYGLIGCPVKHSLSPILQNTISSALNHKNVYTTFNVEEKNLETAINGAYAMNIKGLNVTTPHKKNIIKYLKNVEETAIKLNSVNVLKFSEGGYDGYNTDYIGVKKTFEARGVSLKNKKILLIGAGAASYSAAMAIMMEEPSEIIILNRGRDNAEKLRSFIERIGIKEHGTDVKVCTYDEIGSLEKVNIIVQSSQIGFDELKGQSPITDVKYLEGVEFALDIIYSPWETEFIKICKSIGVETCNGFDMLIFQGVAAYEIWNDMKIDSELVRDIRESLIDYYKAR